MSRPLRYVQLDRPARGRDLAILVALLTFSLVFAALDENVRYGFERQVRATVLSPFLLLHETLAEHALLGERLVALAAERDSLAADLAVSRDAASLVGQLRGLVGLGVVESGDFVVADLLPGRPRIGDSNTFVLTSGTEEGIVSPVGVLAGRGVVGVVRDSRAGMSVGDFWTHPDYRISVRTESGEAVGIVKPRRADDGRVVMELEGTPYQEDIPLGSLLVTSGVAALYPEGVPVGIVREVAEVRTGWAKNYLVEPAVQPDEASVVLVWRRPQLPN